MLMTEKITVKANIEVQSGPSISVNREMELEAYEIIDVDIATPTTDKAINLPTADSGKVLLLVITSVWYGKDKPDTFVTYKVNDGTDVFTLDQPHILIGSSAVKMLDAAPRTLKFSYNPTDATLPQIVKIEILIGLNVT
jgi:hypothetical protein